MKAVISRPEFLFPAQVPTPCSPQYLQMIAEIGRANRIARRFFFLVGSLLLVPVVWLGAIGLWMRNGTVEPEIFIAGINLILAFITFTISRRLSAPFRPYRPVAEVKCAGKMGTATHFRIDIGRCFNELRLRKWWQSPVFPTQAATGFGPPSTPTTRSSKLASFAWA